MNKKGFTLIELLIVVAIIGILAAVGAIVIPNVIEKSKVNSTKANFKNAFNFIQTSITQCEIGQEVQLSKLVSNTKTLQPNICPKIKNFSLGNNSYDVISAFDYHFKAEAWKNPYNTNWNATSTCTVRNGQISGDLGLICIWRNNLKEIIIGAKIDNYGAVMIQAIKIQ